MDKGNFLAIIDPALGESRGHHTGFVEALLASNRVGWDVGFWCHETISRELVEKIEADNVEVSPCFATLYYQYHSGLLAESSLSGYLDRLCEEFYNVFKTLSERAGRSTLLYHTLRWEHARALNSAIQRLGLGGAKLRHIVFLMFPAEPPGSVDCSRSKRAYVDLFKNSTVTRFASCEDYALQYAEFLGRKEKLPVHPCFLADWDGLERQSQAPDDAQVFKATNRETRIVLHLGDPRIDKGFLELPQLLRNLLKKTRQKVQFIIQYACPKEVGPEVGKAMAELAGISAVEKRVQLENGYWSIERLHQAIEQADLVVLNYDPEVFRDRTSGMLWLICWWKTTVAVPYASWLWREAKRLSSPVISIESIQRHGIPTKSYLPTEATANMKYRMQIYRPLFPWLASLKVFGDGSQKGVST